MDLYECTGDPAGTTQVLLGYYKRLSRLRIRGSPPATAIPQNRESANSEEADLSETDVAVAGADMSVSDRITKEISLSNVCDFQSKVESTYRNAFEDRFTDFSSPVSSLASPCTIAGIYASMRKLFPLCHYVLSTAVLTRWDRLADPGQCEEGWDVNEEDTPILDRKNRRILALFFALLMARSQRMLPFFSLWRLLDSGTRVCSKQEPELFTVRGRQHRKQHGKGLTICILSVSQHSTRNSAKYLAGMQVLTITTGLQMPSTKSKENPQIIKLELQCC